jgi:anti-anti-sigma factor
VSGNDDVVWYLRLEEKDLGSVLVLTVHGRVFSQTVADFSAHLARCDSRHCRAVIVDLSGVDYINSQGLSVLEGAATRARASQRELVVCGLQPPVRTAFDLADPAGLTIEASRDAAVRRLGVSKDPPPRNAHT